ncbi:MAG TPA: XdhC family protein [Solirubrobacteraceae bacterium]|nr:XdhC family protein [Solirubrobacteraceae bacterium]
MSAEAERDEWAARSELHGPAFLPAPEPAGRLILFGAVELAAALSELADAIGWSAYVVDPRERYARRELFPGAAEVVVAWPEQAFERLGGIDEATAVAVLTHDPALDDPALEIALRSPAMFVGAMGSRRTQATRRERLADRGLSGEELGRLSGPIGLDLGARTAMETALSILGEIVAVAHGRDGGRLKIGEGSIREAQA